MSQAASLKVRVLFFASLTEAAGARTLEVTLERGATVGDLAARLIESHPALAPRLGLARVAVGEHIVDLEHVLGDGDEVAWLPAVSGG